MTGIEFFHNKKLCVVRPSPVCPGRCNGYVAWPKQVHYYDMDGSEEPTFSGTLTGQGDQWFIGFDTGHMTDSDETSGLHQVIERTKRFAETLRTFKNYPTRWQRLKLAFRR